AAARSRGRYHLVRPGSSIPFCSLHRHMLRLRMDVSQAGHTDNHLPQRYRYANGSRIGHNNLAIDRIARLLRAKCVADLTDVATEINLHLVRIDAVDGEALGREPAGHRNDVRFVYTKLLAVLFRRDPLVVQAVVATILLPLQQLVQRHLALRTAPEDELHVIPAFGVAQLSNELSMLQYRRATARNDGNQTVVDDMRYPGRFRRIECRQGGFRNFSGT